MNKPIEREIVIGETHSYRFRLTAGDFAHVEPASQVVPLGSMVIAPNGSQIFEMGKLGGDPFGIKPISVVAEMSGDYLVKVRAIEKFGRYKKQQFRRHGAFQFGTDLRNGKRLPLGSRILLAGDSHFSGVEKSLQRRETTSLGATYLLSGDLPAAERFLFQSLQLQQSVGASPGIVCTCISGQSLPSARAVE